MKTNFQEILFTELRTFYEPLLEAGADEDSLTDFFLKYGWNIDGLTGGDPTALEAKVQVVINALSTLDTILSSPLESLPQLKQSLANVGNITNAVRDLKIGFTASTPEINKLPLDVLEKLAIIYLAKRSGLTYRFFELIGVIRPEDELIVTDADKILIYKGGTPGLDFQKLVNFINNPVQAFKDFYWPNGFTATDKTDLEVASEIGYRLFAQVANVLAHVGVSASVGRGSGPLEYTTEEETRLSGLMTLSREFFLSTTNDFARAGATVGILPVNEGGPGIYIVPFGELNFEQVIGNWLATLNVGASISGLKINQNSISLIGSANNDLNIGLSLQKLPETTDGAVYLIGSTTGTRLEVGEVAVQAYLNKAGNESNYGVMLNLNRAAFVLNPGDGDGFMRRILPAGGKRIEIELGLGWSKGRGLYFKGSGGLAAELPVSGADLGNSLALHTVGMSLKADTNGISLVTAASGSVTIGPFTAIVEQVGLSADLTFPSNGGNLGPINAEIQFKSPSGIGISIDSEGVKGGGYLYLDPASGRYAGVAEVGVGKHLRLKAAGILEPVPNSSGYSMLFLVYGEFKPIQLGMGFTLSGVGGLLGTHRSAHLSGLRDGVRAGTLERLLFPVNPVAQAQQLLTSAGQWFPVAEGRYVFGFMGKIGWGTPNLLTLDVGVAIELPAPVRVAVFGVLRAQLPNKDKPLVVLQAAFLGSIDTGKGQVAFDATIYDSRLLQFTLSGDVAFRLHYGENPLFLISAGGFHPAFQPPAGAGLGQMRRMAIALSTSRDLTLLLTSYMAITSNTVQFGSRVDLRYRINSKWDIVAFLGFDTLIQLSPLQFLATVSGGAAVRRKQKEKLSLYLTVTVSGPAPWHVHGKVKFKVMGMKFSVSINFMLGRKEQQALPAKVDLTTELLQALSDRGNWSFALAGGQEEFAILREQQGSLAVSPAGVLEIRQRVLPLGLSIDKYGESQPAAGKGLKYEITDAWLGASPANDIAYTDTKDPFAPAQYKEMSDLQRLGAASFEPMKSGIRLSGLDVAKGGRAKRKVVAHRYEVLPRYSPETAQPGLESNIMALESTTMSDPRPVLAGSGMTGAEFSGLLAGSAVARSSRSWERRSASDLQPVPVRLRETQYAVVFKGDLAVLTEGDFLLADFDPEDFFTEVAVVPDTTQLSVEEASFPSMAEAEAYLKGKVAAEPRLKDRLQIVPQHELV